MTQNTQPKIQKPRVPMALTKSRLLMLVKLWSTGYEKGWRADRKETLACRDLCKCGYAEVDPSCPNHFRITEDGVSRLEGIGRLENPLLSRTGHDVQLRLPIWHGTCCGIGRPR